MEDKDGGRNEVLLKDSEVRQLRHALHELSNLLTGILVSGGLVQQGGSAESRTRYLAAVCESGERGAMLLRELRGMLTVALERNGYSEEEPGEPRPPASFEGTGDGEQIHEV